MATLAFLTIQVIVPPAAGQILNIEEKRMREDREGWSGSLGATLDLVKNEEMVLDVGGYAHVEYRNGKGLYMLVSNLHLIRAGENDFENSGYQHLRYNFDLDDRIVAEVFAQVQFNRILQVDFRGLAGAGPRLGLLQGKRLRLYAAALYMFEYEELSDETEPNRDHRISGYVSFAVVPEENVSFAGTTYFQPLIGDVGDCRISSRATLTFGIGDRFSWILAFDLLHDARPPGEVEPTTYSLSNGLSLDF